MNGLDFIKSKQQSWAKRKNFNLLGGTIPNKGEKNYLYSLADNLFEPHTLLAKFHPAKMNHISSAT